MRFALLIEYDGSKYSGWQRQKNGIGVQQVIEEALFNLFSKKIVIVGSGRTDKGVHAAGQVAHFDMDTNLTPYKIKGSLNFFLPEDMKIREVAIVPSDFHSQFDAISKVYTYNTYISKVKRPLKEKYNVQIFPPVDVPLIRECAKAIVGKHDFSGFTVRNREIPTSTCREVTRIDIFERDDGVVFEIEGNGFLYKMVRSIVGTLVWIGRGKLSPDCIEKIMEQGDRALGGKTFSPNGLVLTSVKYPIDVFKE